jgi:predicted negative regulator of RcsB-dependent stress response
MNRRALLLALLVAAGAGPRPAAAAPPPPPAAVAASDEGSRLFRAGAFAAAATQFEAAYQLAPGFEPAGRNLAAALAMQGQQELQAGSLDDARRHLERAAALAPADARVQLLLASLFARRGDLYEARQAVDRALSLDPALGQARELSGDLFYQDGALGRARAEWEQALATGGPGSHALRAKIDRVAREADAEGGFGREVSRHFTIQYDGPVPREVARTALRLLEAAYDRIWREFGRAPQHDVPVILYTRGLFDEITRSPGWVGATYDGKIRVPVGGLHSESDAERLAPILAHELTHAFIRANVPGRLPLWFEEGLAEHFEGTAPEEALRTLRASGGGFARLEDVSQALRGGPRVVAAYAAAALAVAEMVRMNGFWLPSRTLDAMAAGAPLEEAFRRIAGIDLAEFEERWVRAQR